MTDFVHRHAGHCESGVTSALARHHGLALSEPMALGLSSAMIFTHFPFIRVGGIALTSYRMPPGAVYKGLKRTIGLHMRARRYPDADRAGADLDAHLERGAVVGIQASVYWLPYFPPDMRFHFNAHNLIVYGREGDDYLISDPVFETPQRCARKDLRIARFTQGKFAPRGLMYAPEQVPSGIDYAGAGRKAIRRTVLMMRRTPMPWVGLSAIRRLARTMGALDTLEPRRARLFVASVIRMQEEIGTGGGGFRFMYAAFLQELAERLDNDLLREAEAAMTAAGDAWRHFALDGAHYCRDKSGIGPADLEQRLLTCGQREAAAFGLLQRFR